MLQLALSKDMRDALIRHEIAAAQEIDTAIARDGAPHDDFLMSTSMAAQVIGRWLCKLFQRKRKRNCVAKLRSSLVQAEAFGVGERSG